MLEKLYNKVKKDLEMYEEDFIENCTPRLIINNAEDIYHAQLFFYNIEFFTQNFEEDDDYYAISKQVIDKIIAYEDNIVVYWVNHRYDIRHSERYNLENFDDFTSVLDCVINDMGE